MAGADTELDANGGASLSEGFDVGRSSEDAGTREPLVKSAPDEDEEAQSSAADSPPVFASGERPVQDEIYGRAFLACMLLLAVRQAVVFFWPVLGLKLVDLATFSISPFLSIVLGVSMTLPGCFVLLWGTKGTTRSTVKGCLIVVLLFFLVAPLLTVLFHGEQRAGSVEPLTEEMFDDPSHPQPTSPSASFATMPQTAGVLGTPSETALLEAAMPTGINRILMAAGHVATGGGVHVISGAHAHVARAVRRGLLSTTWFAANGAERERLVLVEGVLSNLANAAGAFALLRYSAALFPLAALIISDSSKFVLTRGRGLIFSVILLVCAGVALSPFALSATLQVSKACEAEHQREEDANFAADRALCDLWSTAFPDPFESGFLPIVGYFLTTWLCLLVKAVLQFLASFVVGQCYGNSAVGMEEDDMQLVWRALKCACYESFGTLCLLSLLSTVLMAGSVLLNLTPIYILGDSIVTVVPLLINSFAYFGVSLFLTHFVLPIVALSGQSFADAANSALVVLQRNLFSAVSITLSSLCVIGVLIFVVVTLATVAGSILALILATAGPSDKVQFLLWLFFLLTLVLGTTVLSITLFHWVLTATIACTYVCLALQGSAKESTTSTPLVPKQPSAS